MEKLLTFFILLLGLSLAAGPLFAHHGTRISYDRENSITLEGTVTEFMLRNPHASVFIDVKDEDGNVVNWALEGGTIRGFINDGFNRTTLPVGQEVTVVVFPSKAGVPVGQLDSITLPDGRRHGGGPEPAP